MKYDVAAIDDEFLSLKIISKFCEEHPRIGNCEVFQNVEMLREYLQKSPVQILITDIEMPDENGLKLAREFCPSTKIILSTAYSEFALEGFELNVVDYLLKPYSQVRFDQAIDKAVNLLDLELKSGEGSFILVPANYSKRKLELSEIVAVESIDDYVRFTMEDGEVVTSRKTLKSVLDELPPKNFVRIHRSYIVNKKHVKTIRKNRLEVGNLSLPIGYTYRSVLSELL